ncbi:hypothetical protein, partial [Candidatus Entotheonella palauensis]|uniref:hypothetical protein n=1 Tax=Candidatus Entotheonella palauensis TaxID=93172 RepID=UPI001178443E
MQNGKRSSLGLWMSIVLLWVIGIGMVWDHAYGEVLTATATGSPTPSTISLGDGDTVNNGDFRIVKLRNFDSCVNSCFTFPGLGVVTACVDECEANNQARDCQDFCEEILINEPLRECSRQCGNIRVGSGHDEETEWDFVFSNVSTLTACLESDTLLCDKILRSAKLMLNLTPRSRGVSTDRVWIQGLEVIESSVIQERPVLRRGSTTPVELELLGFYSASNILSVLADNNGKILMRYNDDAIVSFAQLDLEFLPLDAIEVTALIDGRDQLIIEGNTMQWHHFDFAAVGRHQGGNAPTIIAPVSQLGAAWFPEWSEPPPSEVRFEDWSGPDHMKVDTFGKPYLHT